MRHFLCLWTLFQWFVLCLTNALGKQGPNTGKSNLHKHLLHYETLRKSDLDVHVRQQRDVDTGHVTVKRYVKYFTLGRNFNLVLNEGSPVLGPGFKAYTVDKQGKTTSLDIDSRNFFTGHLQENQSIPVDAHYEEGLLCTTVHFPNETYFTEPSWRHLPGSSQYDLISYKLSDVNWSSIGPFPPPLSLRPPPSSNFSALADELYPSITKGKGKRRASREKKAKKTKKTCALRLVADYRFYSIHSGNSAESAATTMVDAIQMANRIYQTTKWDLPDGLGWGFTVKELLVHKQYSNGPQGGVFSYNYVKEYWAPDALLEAFSIDEELDKVCVGHLFTSHSFKYDDGVIGLAFIGNSRRLGGVCSVTMKLGHGEGFMFPRTAWSTSISASGRFLLRFEHQLISVHELGHTWGSPHDPSKCSPSDDEGGTHLMYPYNTPGNLPNNMLFSTCSIDSISDILKIVSEGCFTETTEDEITCGNGIIDGKEECDAGMYGLLDKDECCTKTCTLKTSARCSDLNSPCCRQCNVAPEGTICDTNSDLRCLQASYCDGVDLDCPPPESAADGTPCLDGGTCKDGTCITYCEALGRSVNMRYVPCLCRENDVVACKRCCMVALGENKHSHCFPTNQSISTGLRCFNGACDENGICVPLETRNIFTLESLLQQLDFSSIGDNMKTNMVVTITFLSALIWIPASCYISYLDTKNMKKMKERIAELRAKQEIQSENTDSNYDDVRGRSENQGVSQNQDVNESAFTSNTDSVKVIK